MANFRFLVKFRILTLLKWSNILSDTSLVLILCSCCFVQIEYEVTVEVTECPKDPSQWTREVVISPVGLREDLTINLQMMCECECEQPEFEVRKHF